MLMYSLYICIESDSGILSCPRTDTLIFSVYGSYYFSEDVNNL